MAYVPPTSSIQSTQPPANEGLALLVTFGILVLLSTWDVTSKFALWVAIALVALIWNAAYQSGQVKTFWQALSL